MHYFNLLNKKIQEIAIKKYSYYVCEELSKGIKIDEETMIDFNKIKNLYCKYFFSFLQY